jgi:fatty acid desaturase
MDEQTTASEPAATPSSRSLAQRWRSGRIGFPALVALLLVLGAAGLGAASIGGWGSVTVLVIVIVAFLALITSWTVTG